MKTNKPAVLTVAEKCKNILLSNWEGRLSTIQADSSGSKEGIYSSKVKYLFRKGRPYIWVPEKENHNVNVLIDERSSFSVPSPFPGNLGTLLKSIQKFPARVALTGDVVRLSEEKENHVAEYLIDTASSEQKAISKLGFTVMGILSSSDMLYGSSAEQLQGLVDPAQKHVIYKFNIRSSTFIDCGGGMHEVAVNDVRASQEDAGLSFLSAKLIDGINRNEARRRALALFCLVYLDVHVRDAWVFSLDRKGLDVLGRIPEHALKDGSRKLRWKELRLSLTKEAEGVESFCEQLVDMEENVLQKIKTFSGLS